MFYRLGPPLHIQNGGFKVRISDDARRNVVFFGVASPPDGRITYAGTGFLAGLRGASGTPYPYIVTCRHVARALEDAGTFITRVNLVSGGSHEMPADDVKWRYHPDSSVDLAATFLFLPGDVFDHEYLDIEKSLVAPDVPPHKNVECGDLVHIVGLFRLHHGKQRNVAMVHTGHIAMLPNENERLPIQDRQTGKVVEAVAYLAEVQTLEGLSGSPVFIHTTASLGKIALGKNEKGDDVWASFTSLHDNTPLQAYAGVQLLGLYQGPGMPSRGGFLPQIGTSKAGCASLWEWG
jgi:hypothetical protein